MVVDVVVDVLVVVVDVVVVDVVVVLVDVVVGGGLVMVGQLSLVVQAGQSLFVAQGVAMSWAQTSPYDVRQSWHGM